MTVSTVRLKNVASVRVSNVDKKSVDGEIPVRLCNYTDVYYSDRIRDDRDYMTATATGDQISTFVLRPGQTLITKDSETAEDIGVPAFVEAASRDLVCGYHLAQITPRPGSIVPRYLYWTIASRRSREQFSLNASGVTRFGLRTDAITGLEIPLHSAEQQRRIAEFLDAETSRIDALIAAKQQMIDLAGRRVDTLALDLMTGHKSVPLKRAVQYTEGPGIMAEDFDESGVPLIRISGLAGSVVSLLGCNFLDPDTVAKRWNHFRLAEGDYLISASATMGIVAVVDSTAAGAVPYTGLIRFRPRSSDVDMRYIRHFLAGTDFRRQIDLLKTGTAIQHFGPTHLDQVAVGLPHFESQQAIANRLDRALDAANRLTATLTRQTELLRERRQALITAAVSGELDVT